MSTKLFTVNSFLVSQGNVQLGQFVGLSLGPNLTATNEGLVLGLDATPLVKEPVAISALNINWSLGDVFFKTLAAGASVFTFTNTTDGQVIIVEVTGAASTLTWPTVKWAGGVAPTQTASGTDVYTFVKRGSSIFGSVVQAMA